MLRFSLLTSMTAGLLLLGNAHAADIKSGLQVGESVKSFSPLHVTGPDAGKTSCLV